jgi:hypothetical protein
MARSETGREQILNTIGDNMNKMILTAAFAILAATAACSSGNGQPNPGASFDNGLRQNAQTPTTCSPADSTCGSGLGNPSVQSPIQKREQDASPQ